MVVSWRTTNRRLFLASAFGMTADIFACPRWPVRTVDLPTSPDGRALDQMIGEMIVMGFWGTDPASPGARIISSWLRDGLVGGVIFFEDNLRSPDAAIDLIQAFREAAGAFVPLFCVDQEGGAVARLRPERGFEPLPAARTVGTLSRRAAEVLYDRTARELDRLGFNANLGPVVDLALNPDNAVIEGLGRSYGANPETAIAYAKAFIEAHRRNHILTALKHFPGEGYARVDTHRSLARITNTWRPEELRPFSELIIDGYADIVMMGHLVHAYLSEPGRPASLSPRAIQVLLRTTLGYRGAVISDDMQMGALTEFFSPDECILLGIEAGLDLFIYSNRQHPDPQMPARFHRVANAAVESERIQRRRIEESVHRISTLKQSINLSRDSSTEK
jgi:beta-N-acetylhexosaminidase